MSEIGQGEIRYENSPERQLEDPLAFLRPSKVTCYPKGVVIFSPGDNAEEFYLIVSGRVKISFVGPERDTVLHLLRIDDLFGESAFVECQRSTGATALEDTRVMSWTRQQVREAASLNPDLYLAFLQLVVVRAQRLEGRIRELTTRSVSSRLANALLELASQSNSNEEPVSLPRLTQEILATYIGSSREAVALELNRLRRAGCIDYSRRDFQVYRNRLHLFLSTGSSASQQRLVPRPQTSGLGLHAGL